MTGLILLPGDVVLTRSTRGWLGKAIRFFEKRPGDPAWANHVGLVVKEGQIAPPFWSSGRNMAEMVEALWKVRRGSVWGFYGPNAGENRPELLIYRPHALPMDVRLKIASAALEAVGRKYAWWRLALHAADWWFSKKAGREVYAARMLNWATETECSGLLDRAMDAGLVGTVYASAGFNFGIPEGAIPQPDDIEDFCRTHPEKYTLVFGPGRLGA